MDINELKKSRDEVLRTTIRIITLTLEDDNLKEIKTGFIKTMLINTVLDKLAQAWRDNGDVFNLSHMVDDIKYYTDKPHMHMYKVLKLLNEMKNILNPTTKQFCLN